MVRDKKSDDLGDYCSGGHTVDYRSGSGRILVRYERVPEFLSKILLSK